MRVCRPNRDAMQAERHFLLHWQGCWGKCNHTQTKPCAIWVLHPNVLLPGGRGMAPLSHSETQQLCEAATCLQLTLGLAPTHPLLFLPPEEVCVCVHARAV